MALAITSVDYAPEDLYAQVPFLCSLLREIAGPDRPDYWLASLRQPLRWQRDGRETTVTHVILSARYVGEELTPQTRRIVVGLAYVTDDSLLDDARLDFAKCHYAAIGVAEFVADADR